MLACHLYFRYSQTRIDSIWVEYIAEICAKGRRYDAIDTNPMWPHYHLPLVLRISNDVFWGAEYLSTYET